MARGHIEQDNARKDQLSFTVGSGTNKKNPHIEMEEVERGKFRNGRIIEKIRRRDLEEARKVEGPASSSNEPLNSVGTNISSKATDAEEREFLENSSDDSSLDEMENASADVRW